MREELKNEQLEEVSGGRYFINNKNVLYLETMPDKAFPLVGSRYVALEIMDGLIGKYNSEAEYDAACVQALKAAGII